MRNEKLGTPVTDKGYQGLAENAYYKSNYEIGEAVLVDTIQNPDGSWDYETWTVVDTLQNEKHDVHAIAVTNGDEIVIAYRGTKPLAFEIDSIHSWSSSFQKNSGRLHPREKRIEQEISKNGLNDVREFRNNFNGMRDQTIESYKEQGIHLDNPYDVANDFANQVHEKYPDKRITTTGGSEGGRAAVYVHVNNPNVSSATAYSSPVTWDLFTDKQERSIRAGDFDASLRQFSIEGDLIGNHRTWWKDEIGTEVRYDSSVGMMYKHDFRAYDEFFRDDGMLIDGIAPYNGYHPHILDATGKPMQFGPISYAPIQDDPLWDFQAEILKAATHLMYPSFLYMNGPYYATGNYTDMSEHNAIGYALSAGIHSDMNKDGLMSVISNLMEYDQTGTFSTRLKHALSSSGAGQRILVTVEILEQYHEMIRYAESITIPKGPPEFTNTKSRELEDLFEVARTASQIKQKNKELRIQRFRNELKAFEKYWETDKELSQAIKATKFGGG